MLPVDAAQHGGCELRHRRKRDQPDRDQRVGLARKPEVRVAEQHDSHDRAAADCEQPPGQVAALARVEQLEPQQQRHDQIVAHHRRQRDGFDDDHSRRRGQAAQEHRQREQLLVLEHRQRQDEHVGIDLAAGKVQQAAERDRQHEQVDRQQVEREHPARLSQVALVDVLDHGDLELARQEHDGEHRQHDQPCPARIAAAGPLGRREHRGELGVGGGAGEQITEAAVDAEGDEQPDRKEGGELDHRLECDRRDHALVTLGRVEMARAEQDRERGQQQRDVESGVGQQRHFADVPGHGDVGVVREHGEAVRYRLELQRDVGDDADHCDHGDEPGEQRALAVARADEVRDRGDAVGLADRDDLANDDEPQRGDQRGSQVDRQEPDSARRRAPHASVERPRGRVNAERERVDVGVGDQAAALVGAAVAVPGDAEQRAEVCERYDADDPALEHAGRGAGRVSGASGR